VVDAVFAPEDDVVPEVWADGATEDVPAGEAEGEAAAGRFEIHGRRSWGTRREVRKGHRVSRRRGNRSGHPRTQMRAAHFRTQTQSPREVAFDPVPRMRKRRDSGVGKSGWGLVEKGMERYRGKEKEVK
jgi:hypothetical protein